MYFWLYDVNSQLIGKVPDAGKDWGQKKRVSEDEMAGWYRCCNRQELGQTLGDGEGEGGLACCNPWCQRVGHDWVTEQQQHTWCTILYKLQVCSMLLLLLSCFSRVRLFTTPWTAAHQAPPSMGFSRQEYWSGLPLPSLICSIVTYTFEKIIPFIFIIKYWLPSLYCTIYTSNLFLNT